MDGAKIRHDFGNKTSVRTAELDTASGRVTVTFESGKGSKTYANFTPELLEAWKADPRAGQWFYKNVRLRPGAHPEVFAEDDALVAPAVEQTIGQPPVGAGWRDVAPTTLEPAPEAAYRDDEETAKPVVVERYEVPDVAPSVRVLKPQDKLAERVRGRVKKFGAGA